MVIKKRVSSKKKSKITKKRKNPKNAKPEQYFILVTGMPLKNLKELANSLETMNDWVFNHHVNNSRNDFANWVNDILEEKTLAEDLKSLKNIRDMELAIFKYIVNIYL